MCQQDECHWERGKIMTVNFLTKSPLMGIANFHVLRPKYLKKKGTIVIKSRKTRYFHREVCYSRTFPINGSIPLGMSLRCFHQR